MLSILGVSFISKNRELESANKFYDQDNSGHSQSLKSLFPEPVWVSQKYWSMET